LPILEPLLATLVKLCAAVNGIYHGTSARNG